RLASLLMGKRVFILEDSLQIPKLLVALIAQNQGFAAVAHEHECVMRKLSFAHFDSPGVSFGYRLAGGLASVWCCCFLPWTEDPAAEMVSPGAPCQDTAAGGRSRTLAPSARSTAGLRMTWSPRLMPLLTSTSRPRSRTTPISRR